MKNKRIFKISALVIVAVAQTLFPLQQGQAALISADSPFGPGTITLDTVTQLRWLDLTVTTNRSYNNIVSQLAPGGIFEGFRYANNSEVSQFWVNAGILDQSGSFTTNNFEPVSSFISLVGQTGGQPGLASSAFGLSSTPLGLNSHASEFVETFLPAGRGRAVLMFNGYGSDDLARPDAGHWLVSVPEPGIFALLTVGGLSLSLRLRRSARNGHNKLS